MERKSCRVAVIGAGVAGLLAIKSCLEEGHEPVCFEQHDQIGGTWYYSDELRPNQTAGAYKDLVTNIDTALMSFSDFPVPVEQPILCTVDRYQDYLLSYVKHFDLRRHILFNHTVTKAAPTEDHKATGQWEVFVRSRDSDVDERHVFDAVMLCSGALKNGFIPDIPGLSDFTGKIMHATDFRRPEDFKDQTVLVIGKQFSACDQACLLRQHAKKIYLSMGEGTHILPIIKEGRYVGTYLSRRQYLQPDAVIGQLYIDVAAANVNHAQFGIGDGGNPLNGGYFMLSDELVPSLMADQISIVPRVEHFSKDSVTYVDGSTQEIDAVLFGTGYKQDYNFVKCADIRGDNQVDFNLYKGVFPTSCKHPTLAVISSIPLIGSFMLPVELGARWAARVLAKTCTLPDPAIMQNWVIQKQAYIRDTCHGKYQFTAYSQAEEIGAELGIQPRFSRLFLRSPSLAYKVYFGPPHTCHYRLVGPGACQLAWTHSHAFYDRLFPNDIPGQVWKLARHVITGSLLAAMAYLVSTNWNHISETISGFHR